MMRKSLDYVRNQIYALGGESTNHFDKFQTNLWDLHNGERVSFDAVMKYVLIKYQKYPSFVEGKIKSLDAIDFGMEKDSSQLIAQIHKFADNHAPSFRWNRNYQKALQLTQHELLMLRGSRPLKVQRFVDDQQLLEALPKEDAHAGFTYFVSGKRYKGENIDGAIERFQQEMKKALEIGSFNKIILPGIRLQCSEALKKEYDIDGNLVKVTPYAKRKTRLVNMVDFNVIIAEMMFQKPIQQLFHNWNSYSEGKNPDDKRSLIRTNHENSKYWISLDYSAYDQTLPGWLIEDCFGILWNLFSKDEQTQSYKSLFNVIVHDFIHKAFLSKNNVVFAHHGVPSGSMFTQIMDTLCNYVMILTYLVAKYDNPKRVLHSMVICGDDNLIHTHVPLHRPDISNYIKHNFGVDCNDDKGGDGTKADDPEFLSREWRLAGEWREPKVLISRLCYPESFRDYKKVYEDGLRLKPEAILKCYQLTYPLGMEEFFDFERMDRELPVTDAEIDLAMRRHGPGLAKYGATYLR